MPMGASTITSVRRGAPLLPGTGRPAAHRHPGDLLRVGLGIALLGLAFLVARRGQLSIFETDVFRLINDLPALIYVPVWTVMQLGNGMAVFVLAGVAALARRFRMARDLLLAAGLASLATTLAKAWVGRERPGGLPVGAVLHEAILGGNGFVSGHSAVAAALATAAAPYLSRRLRRVAWALALTVGLARIYVGAHLPLDVLGGLLVGWISGSLVHYVFGVPRWEPTAAHVADLLARFGLPAQQLRPAAVHARSSHPFLGTAADGRRLFIKVLDPDPFDRDWLYRGARMLVVGDVKDVGALASLGRQAVDEAVAAMTARERGVRVPPVLLARGTDGRALVVQELVDARSLESLSPQEITADLLGRVWEQVAGLGAARIAHRDLVASNVLVDRAGDPWIVDFGNAETGADADAVARDVAELMTSLALRSAPEVIADSAVAGLGRDVVTHALPSLEPLSLSAVTRAELRTEPTRLDDLRRETYRRLALPETELPRLQPAGVLAWLAVLAGAATVFVGLQAIGGTTGVLAEVEFEGWRWLGAAVAIAFVSRAAAAVAARSAVDRRLAVGRMYAADLVTAGAALVHGRPGGRVVAGRYYERAGVLPGSAVHAYERIRSGTTLGAAAVAAASVVLALADGRLTTWRYPDSLLALAALGSTAFLLVSLGQAFTRRHAPASAARQRAGLRRLGGRRIATVVGWSAAAIALEAAALVAALHGVGGHVPVTVSAAVYTVLRLFWVALPATGAPGIAEVSLVLALTALGEPLTSACAGVLVFRLLTFWAPAVLGSLLAARFAHRLFL
ncbi:undecaprenyl-diphosphatase [Blastococcus aggregatus]|uniref:Undecaprenyl-diphosphatase n=2 Tax=Blastococcus aggregatus TaxID=38502 RepID=A0A285UWB4_9ACTN|nr:undecaprenyl-diphosphatase [Blastococcus aggregatus]